jgi:hypothetical protein
LEFINLKGLFRVCKKQEVWGSLDPCKYRNGKNETGLRFGVWGFGVQKLRV